MSSDYYMVCCSRKTPANQQLLDEKLGVLAKTCRGIMNEPVFSFGQRDYNFVFRTEKAARKFNAALGRRAGAWSIINRGIGLWNDCGLVREI